MPGIRHYEIVQPATSGELRAQAEQAYSTETPLEVTARANDETDIPRADDRLRLALEVVRILNLRNGSAFVDAHRLDDKDEATVHILLSEDDPTPAEAEIVID